MKFFEHFVEQQIKTNYIVCGDAYLADKTPERTVFILCDGIGSGVYANISAITCANRLMELINLGVSPRSAAEMTAKSMHDARSKEMPFSAFSLLEILADGQFSVHSYESPEPILIRNSMAAPMKPHFYTAGYEVIGESVGRLAEGEIIILCSDGVAQSGMGRKGYGLGIGSAGICDYVNDYLKKRRPMPALSEELVKYAKTVCGGRFEDDTSCAVIRCRQAFEITIATGPPSNPSLDKLFAEEFISKPGYKVICGSTTTDLISRELGLEAKIITMNVPAGQPPEYMMEGVDIVSEGAIMLNQVLNILDEDPDKLGHKNVVERLAKLFYMIDAVNFMVGKNINEAHTDPFFKQMGIKPRRQTIDAIAKKLKEKGKLVNIKYY